MQAHTPRWPGFSTRPPVSLLPRSRHSCASLCVTWGLTLGSSPPTSRPAVFAPPGPLRFSLEKLILMSSALLAVGALMRCSATFTSRQLRSCRTTPDVCYTLVTTPSSQTSSYPNGSLLPESSRNGSGPFSTGFRPSRCPLVFSPPTCHPSFGLWRTMASASRTLLAIGAQRRGFSSKVSLSCQHAV